MVAGLGNVGERYSLTYHNLGFMAADAAAARMGLRFKSRKYMAALAEGRSDAGKVYLIKPETFMNLSGDAVKSYITALKIPIENLLVVYDDIDLEKGTLRLRESGSAGTHNGMKNIIERLGTDAFKRLRIGAGRPPEHMELADYVLSNINTASREILKPAIARAAEAIEAFVCGVPFDRIGADFNGAAK